jgi:hypothetical protein
LKITTGIFRSSHHALAVIPRGSIRQVFPRTSCLFDETWLADSLATFQREIDSPAGVNLASALAAFVLPGVVHWEAPLTESVAAEK